MNDEDYERTFHAGLQTSVLRVSYDFVRRTGECWLPDLCCVDFTGAIKLFTDIDPNVERIVTYAGDREDTAYIKQGTKWSAYVRRDERC